MLPLPIQEQFFTSVFYGEAPALHLLPSPPPLQSCITDLGNRLTFEAVRFPAEPFLFGSAN